MIFCLNLVNEILRLSGTIAKRCLGGYVVKRTNLVLALSACMTLGSVIPAFAGSGDNAGLDRAVDGSLMVTRVTGLGAGLLLGIPVGIARQTRKAYVDMTNGAADKVGGKMGGKDNGPTCGIVSLVTLPAAMVVGTAKGTYMGGKNAIVHGFNEPFNPESFSTGKLED